MGFVVFVKHDKATYWNCPRFAPGWRSMDIRIPTHSIMVSIDEPPWLTKGKGMPATGAIARTATNVNAGGKTPVAGVLHAVFILLVMLVAAPLAGYLALPALAGLLLITAWNMSEPHKWRGYWAEPIEDRVLLVLTLVLTVVADLTVAIGTGVALGLLLQLRQRRASPPDWKGPER